VVTPHDIGATPVAGRGFMLSAIIATRESERLLVPTLAALVPVFVFQTLTAPIAAHMVGRAAYRTGQLDAATLEVDELGPAIARTEQEHGG